MLAAVAPASAGAAIELERVAEFDQPVYVHGPAGAGEVVFVVEQRGVVKVLRGDRRAKGSFLDIRDEVASLGGAVFRFVSR